MLTGPCSFDPVAAWYIRVGVCGRGGHSPHGSREAGESRVQDPGIPFSGMPPVMELLSARPYLLEPPPPPSSTRGRGTSFQHVGLWGTFKIQTITVPNKNSKIESLKFWSRTMFSHFRHISNILEVIFLKPSSGFLLKILKLFYLEVLCMFYIPQIAVLSLLLYYQFLYVP